MSGRLIILPKKSYCPWSSKNIERVERDEREHLLKEEQKREQEIQDESRTRLIQLKSNKRQREQQQHPEDNKDQERFSLFLQEEEQHLKKQQEDLLLGTKGQQHQREVNKNNKNFLASSRGQSTPFYMTLPSQQQQKDDGDDTTKLDYKQTKLKRDMDPMKQFCNDEEEPISQMEVISQQQKQESETR